MFGFFKREFIHRDTVLCLLAMVVFYLLASWFHIDSELVFDRNNVNYGSFYSTVAQICAGFLGFIIAAASITLGLSDGKRIEALKKSPHYPKVLEAHFSASLWFFVGLILSLGFSVYTDPNYPPQLTHQIFLFLTAVCAVKIWRILNLLNLLFRLSLAD